MNKQSILVELDALLDTRIATLGIHDPKVAAKVLRAGYHTRLSDDFEKLSEGAITNEMFRDLYAKRDGETIKASMLTTMNFTLCGMLIGLERKLIENVEVGSIEVVVNIAPYQIDPHVCDVLVSALQSRWPVTASVRWINKPMAELTPHYIDSAHDAFILYNYDEWNTLCAHHMKDKPMPMVTLYIPRLLLPGIELDDPRFIHEGGRIDPFAYNVVAHFGRLIVEYLEPVEYSIIDLSKVINSAFPQP
ncbi:hypothetical protein ACLPJK_25950 [Pseudomonas aeruginosa]|uniref:hypothetical protein n=1 Tax=Pseudomonas aeruginosa TaxID=287 RepID=UPI003D2C6580